MNGSSFQPIVLKLRQQINNQPRQMFKNINVEKTKCLNNYNITHVQNKFLHCDI